VTGTTAVPAEVLAAGPGRPLCPACREGRLHPFEVEITFPGGLRGVDRLTGWVAVCIGNRDEATAHAEAGAPAAWWVKEPCGFSMPMTPHAVFQPGVWVVPCGGGVELT
jgi:hypothetical protein